LAIAVEVAGAVAGEIAEVGYFPQDSRAGQKVADVELIAAIVSPLVLPVLTALKAT
jgi:hypothetical protein